MAFEFAIPQIPGTGNIAVCTYGEYFIFGNSGPFIESMAQALVLPNVASMREHDDYLEIEPEIDPLDFWLVYPRARDSALHRAIAERSREISSFDMGAGTAT